MSEYAVEKRETAPKNFFAGDFPTLMETGTANAEIKEFAPVMFDASNDNKIIPVAKGSEASAMGISAAAAGNGEPVIYYMTGEFFADALNTETGAEIAKIKDALRKVSIFLR